jgi:hypothetical protein
LAVRAEPGAGQHVRAKRHERDQANERIAARSQRVDCLPKCEVQRRHQLANREIAEQAHADHELGGVTTRSATRGMHRILILRIAPDQVSGDKPRFRSKLSRLRLTIDIGLSH